MAKHAEIDFKQSSRHSTVNVAVILSLLQGCFFFLGAMVESLLQFA